VAAVLDHVAIEVSDYPASKAFYEAALAPLGISMKLEFREAAAGFGGADEQVPYFWINGRGRPVSSGLHLAFPAADRGMVDHFHAAALEAGGSDNGGPGARPVYHPHYYGAFVLDPDGNNVEAVCHVAP
jgi:catechol 2,3-dioxygenase-like lactoylglutathione lyase family enzyme